MFRCQNVSASQFALPKLLPFAEMREVLHQRVFSQSLLQFPCFVFSIKCLFGRSFFIDRLRLQRIFRSSSREIPKGGFFQQELQLKSTVSSVEIFLFFNMSQESASLLDSSNLQSFQNHLSKSKLLQGILRIKPQVMQQVLRSIIPAEAQNAEVVSNGRSEKAGGMKLMELFPERKCRAEPQRDSNPLIDSCSERSSPGFPQEKPKEHSQLTIFYNGIVNTYTVSHEKAQDIIRFAASNFPNEPTLDTSIDLKLEEISSSAIPSPVDENPKLLAGLSQMRKKSLQSFLQKRKDRLNSLCPYLATNHRTKLH